MPGKNATNKTHEENDNAETVFAVRIEDITAHVLNMI